MTLLRKTNRRNRLDKSSNHATVHLTMEVLMFQRLIDYVLGPAINPELKVLKPAVKPFESAEVTTFHRFLAVHMHFAQGRSVLAD